MALVLTLMPGSTFNVAARRFVVGEDRGATLSVIELGSGEHHLTEAEMVAVGEGVHLGQGPRLNPGQPRILVEAPRDMPIWRGEWTGNAPVALLAPVPLEHLISGEDTCRRNGRVAFGSNAFDALHGLEKELGRQPCNAYLYASDEGLFGPPRVTWRATYLGWVASRNGAHPAKMTYRPESTAKYQSDNQGHWACFWEVTDLRLLPPDEALPIGGLKRRDGKPLAKGFIPKGPLIVHG